MKTLALILILIFSILLAGCNRDAQANLFMKEFDTVTAEISEKLEQGEVDEARKILETKKDSIKTKWQTIKPIYAFQVSDGIMKRMNKAPIENMERVTAAANKAIEKNPANHAKVQKLVDDLANLVRR